MPSTDLLQRIRSPRPDGYSAERPWDDAGVRQITALIQSALRRDCPELLNPTERSRSIEQQLMTRIQRYLRDDPHMRLPGVSPDHLAHQVFDYTAGLGPLGALLEQPMISEIMVNRHDDIWIEIEGQIRQLPEVAFRDDTHVFYVAQRILAPLNIELSAARPLAEGRLPGNIRVAASMPPAGPHTTLSIRKPAFDCLTTEQYIERGTATREMLAVLQAVVRGRGNLLIAGPTGTGKSTLLRYLGAFFDPTARIVVLEQVAELGLERHHPHVLSLEARTEAQGGTSMADLLQHALHRRPDYIVVGEVLGPEALQLLLAMATGHPGVSTVHAQSPARLFDRLSLAILQARLHVTNHDLLRYLAEAVDVVAYIERLADGQRRITIISEIIGFKENNPVLRTLFRFVPESVHDGLVTGSFQQENAPSLALTQKLRRWGVFL